MSAPSARVGGCVDGVWLTGLPHVEGRTQWYVVLTFQRSSLMRLLLLRIRQPATTLIPKLDALTCQRISAHHLPATPHSQEDSPRIDPPRYVRSMNFAVIDLLTHMQASSWGTCHRCVTHTSHAKLLFTVSPLVLPATLSSGSSSSTSSFVCRAREVCRTRTLRIRRCYAARRRGRKVLT